MMEEVCPDCGKLKEKIELLRSTLKQCAAKFDEYAQIHRAKNTPESDGDALVNEGYAKMIMNVLKDTIL